MSAKLIITDNENSRSYEVELTRNETQLGRAADNNEIVLDDAQVSRQHAVVKLTGQGFTLVDPGSANGTFVNGQRIQEHALKDGDTFSIGKFTIEFKYQLPAVSIRYDEQK